MRDGDELAWGEFVDRFRPLLEQYASRTRIPRWEWSTCIEEVLDDIALKLATRHLALPSNLGTYLVRAVRNRHLALQRANARRARRYDSVVSDDRVVASLCSEATRRASEGPALDVDTVASKALARLASLLCAEMSEDDVLLLTWRSSGVPTRQVAEWLGITYEAAAKRIERLSRRVRAVAWLRAEGFPPEERSEIARFFRRLGVEPTGDKVRRGARG